MQRIVRPCFLSASLCPISGTHLAQLRLLVLDRFFGFRDQFFNDVDRYVSIKRFHHILPTRIPVDYFRADRGPPILFAIKAKCGKTFRPVNHRRDRREAMLSILTVQVAISRGRTSAISGSQPYANHTARFYCESAASLGSATGPGVLAPHTTRCTAELLPPYVVSLRSPHKLNLVRSYDPSACRTQVSLRSHGQTIFFTIYGCAFLGLI